MVSRRCCSDSDDYNEEYSNSDHSVDNNKQEFITQSIANTEAIIMQAKQHVC